MRGARGRGGGAGRGGGVLVTMHAIVMKTLTRSSCNAGMEWYAGVLPIMFASSHGML